MSTASVTPERSPAKKADGVETFPFCVDAKHCGRARWFECVVCAGVSQAEAYLVSKHATIRVVEPPSHRVPVRSNAHV